MSQAGPALPLKTERTRLRRFPGRGSYDLASVANILDAGFIGHVGFTAGGQPFVLPTLYVRDGETLIIHGSSASRMMEAVAAVAPLCLTVSLIDAVVLARTAFNHTMNYRSAMVLGRAHALDGTAKRDALQLLTERIAPGRWNDVRHPTPQEMKATLVVRMTIEEASAKSREGQPGDEGDALDVPCWAGVIPLRTSIGEPCPDDRLAEDIAVPDYVRNFRVERRRAGAP